MTSPGSGVAEPQPTLNETQRPKVAPWEPAELGKFLDAVQTDGLAALYELAAMSGLRRGELLGLRWIDTDLERRQITVRQQLTQVGYATAFGPPHGSATSASRPLRLLLPLPHAPHNPPCTQSAHRRSKAAWRALLQSKPAGQEARSAGFEARRPAALGDMLARC